MVSVWRSSDSYALEHPSWNDGSLSSHTSHALEYHQGRVTFGAATNAMLERLSTLI